MRITSGHTEPVWKGKVKVRPRSRPSPPLPSENARMNSNGTGEYVDPSSKSVPASCSRASKQAGVHSQLRPRQVCPSSIGKGKAKKSTTPPLPNDDDEPTNFGATDYITASIVLNPP